MKAYAKVTASSGGGAASGAGSQSFAKMKENMGMLAGRPMTRSEAMLILNLAEEEEEKKGEEFPEETLDPKEIMQRFDTLIEKNQIEKGGSFYVQSKIYWAKEHLMQEFPASENVSVWNPDGSGKKAMDKEEEMPKDEEKK